MYKSTTVRSNLALVSKCEKFIDKMPCVVLLESRACRASKFDLDIKFYSLFEMYKLKEKLYLKKFVSFMELENHRNHLQEDI